MKSVKEEIAKMFSGSRTGNAERIEMFVEMKPETAGIVELGPGGAKKSFYTTERTEDTEKSLEY